MEPEIQFTTAFTAIYHDLQILIAKSQTNTQSPTEIFIYLCS